MPDVAGLYHRFGVKLPALNDGWASTRCFTGYHQDRHPSARVHLRSGGFRCFACNTAGGVLDALQFLGIHDRKEARQLAIDYEIIDPPKRRAHQPISPQNPSQTHAQIPIQNTTEIDSQIDSQIDYDNLSSGAQVVRERTWVYVDEHSTPVGRVRRLDLADGSKRIFQERPDGDNWRSGLDGAQLPLYKLPQVHDRARHGGRVLVVEGEKTCDALDRLGLFATTSPGGAGKWRDEHTNALEGATVLAISDCDLPGRLHAIHLTAELAATGTRVLAPLDPVPSRNDGYDIVDYLADLAATIRAVNARATETTVRASLHDHLQRLLRDQLPSSPDDLQRQREHAHYIADPTHGRAYINCHRCGQHRVHRLAYGLAFCPCGAHQAAPT